MKKENLMSKPTKGTIKNWGIIYFNHHGYVIVGETNGSFIRTSPIIALIGDLVVRQSRSG